MNVYDFDKTIYPQDSSVEFYLFNLKKSPHIILYWPLQGYAFLLYALKMISKTKMKEQFYQYFRLISNLDQRVEAFWEENESKINTFYIQQKNENDVIISASPEFLLKPLCDKLKVNLIASIVDPKTGQCEENCYGKEKVKRFKEIYPTTSIESFYSDSLSDDPLAQIADRAYLVKGVEIGDWPK